MPSQTWREIGTEFRRRRLCSGDAESHVRSILDALPNFLVCFPDTYFFPRGSRGW